MTFDPILILNQFNGLGDHRRLVIAYSGGLDSSVLLQALVQLRNSGKLRQQLAVIHIHHGLNPAADDWQRFCEKICLDLGVEFRCFKAGVKQAPGRSLEEQARNARYRVFSSQLNADDCLVMAHHKDDEVENLLLRLTRGSGPGGLAGIPRSRALGKAILHRPLLSFQREELLEYARRQELVWIEDDSNTNTDFDRNFWRHEILPLIGRRFPGFRESWGKSMALIGETDTLLQELAASDLSGLVTDDPRIVNTEPLQNLSGPRQRNVLRYWMSTLGFEPPGWQLMQRLSNEILTSKKSGARLDCAAGTVQRYGRLLVLLKPGSNFDASDLNLDWRPRLKPVQELENNGELRMVAGTSKKPNGDQSWLRGDISELIVRYRSKGQQGRLVGRPNKPVKKILQESNVAPWLRSRQPLLFCNGELACIPGVGVCEGFQAGVNRPGMEITWDPPELLFGADEKLR